MTITPRPTLSCHRPHASRTLGLACLVLVACGTDEPVHSIDQDAGAEVDAEGDAGSADVLDDTASVDATADADAAPDAPIVTPSTLDFDLMGTGPYGVGYRSWQIEYAVPPDGAMRTVTVNAWYPTTDTEGEHPRYANVFPDPTSLIDAVAADPVDGVAYPVVVHSHGHQSIGGGSAFIMRRLASHGWVALAPDHEGNTFFDNSRGDMARHYIERPMDIISTLDAIDDLPDDDPLRSADTSRVLMTGHSRGASTVWAVCGAQADEALVRGSRPDATDAEIGVFVGGFDDERVVACLPLAGAYRENWYGPDGYTSVTEPLMVLSGSADNPDSMRRMWDALTEARLTWAELEGGCHETFGLNACDVLDPIDSEPAVGTLVLAFARHHVLGDDAEPTLGVLSGDVSVAPFVTIQSR